MQNQLGFRRAADIAMVVGALCLVYRWSSGGASELPGQTSRGDFSIQANQPLVIPEVRMLSAGRTLILAIQTTCRGCAAGVGFYRRLLEMCEAGVHCAAAVVSPQPVGVVDAWLVSNRLRPASVSQIARKSDVGLHTTPTVILVDAGGIVTDLVVGPLTQDQEQQLLQRVAGVTKTEPLNTETQVSVLGSDSEFRRFVEGTKALVVDVREPSACDRTRLPSARCLQQDELEHRIIRERGPASVVVDCRFLPSERCRNAARRLSRVGVSDIAVFVTDGPR